MNDLQLSQSDLERFQEKWNNAGLQIKDAIIQRGEALLEIREKLKNNREFDKSNWTYFIESKTDISRRAAHNYINAYKNAKTLNKLCASDAQMDQIDKKNKNRGNLPSIGALYIIDANIHDIGSMAFDIGEGVEISTIDVDSYLLEPKPVKKTKTDTKPTDIIVDLSKNEQPKTVGNQVIDITVDEQCGSPSQDDKSPTETIDEKDNENVEIDDDEQEQGALWKSMEVALIPISGLFEQLNDKNKLKFATYISSMTSLVSSREESSSLEDSNMISSSSSSNLNTNTLDKKEVMSGIEKSKPKKPKEIKTYSPEIEKLMDLFLGYQKIHNPRLIMNNVTRLKWINHLDKCHRIDKRDLTEINNIIIFLRDNDDIKTNFWSRTCQSTENFRKNYSKIYVDFLKGSTGKTLSNNERMLKRIEAIENDDQ